MKTKKPNYIWIILGIIVLIIGALSFTNCLNERKSVEYSEFRAIIKAAEKVGIDTIDIADFSGNNAIDATEIAKDLARNTNATKVQIENVLFDGYVVKFDLKLLKADGNTSAYLTYQTN